MTTRRRFVLNMLPASAAFLGGGSIASAQSIRLEESDKITISLGYKHDAAEVDAKKQVTFAQGQFCCIASTSLAMQQTAGFLAPSLAANRSTPRVGASPGSIRRDGRQGHR